MIARPPGNDAKDSTGLWADGLVLLAILLASVIYMFLAVPGYFVETQGGDYPFYVEMARQPLGNGTPSPWRFRLLNPLLASVLMAGGLSPDVAFLCLTFVFALASCVAMRIFLRQLSLSLFAARFGAVLFAVSVGGFVPLRRYYGYTDALTNFLILATLILAAAGRVRSTAAVLGIGTVAKESTLLLLPFLAWRMKRSGASWPQLLLVVGIPLAVFALLRIVVGASDPTGATPIGLTTEAMLAYWKTAMVHGVVRWILWAFAYSMGPVWLIAALSARYHIGVVGSFALFSLAMVVPLILTTDTERALMLQFPVVYALAAAALDDYAQPRHRVGLALLVVACALAAQMTFEWSPTLRVGVVNAKDVAFLLLSVAPVAALLWSRSRGPARPPVTLGWPV